MSTYKNFEEWKSKWIYEHTINLYSCHTKDSFAKLVWEARDAEIAAKDKEIEGLRAVLNIISESGCTGLRTDICRISGMSREQWCPSCLAAKALSENHELEKVKMRGANE